MSTYLVTGNRRFRGYSKGETFEAVLDRMSERRAVMRGDIRLVSTEAPTIQPGSYRLPLGWDTPTPERRA